MSSRADYGTRKGEIFINGKPGDLGSYKKLIGFVPQEDVFIFSIHSSILKKTKFIAKGND